MSLKEKINTLIATSHAMAEFKSEIKVGKEYTNPIGEYLQSQGYVQRKEVSSINFITRPESPIIGSETNTLVSYCPNIKMHLVKPLLAPLRLLHNPIGFEAYQTN